MKSLSGYRIVIAVCCILSVIAVSCVEDPVIYPIMATIQVPDTDIGSTTAKLKAEVTDAGNQKILEYGIEIYKKIITAPAGRQSIQGVPPVGIFEVSFSGLEPNTLYYYRAYALINTAEYYSQNAIHQFTTKAK